MKDLVFNPDKEIFEEWGGPVIEEIKTRVGLRFVSPILATAWSATAKPGSCRKPGLSFLVSPIKEVGLEGLAKILLTHPKLAGADPECHISVMLMP